MPQSFWDYAKNINKVASIEEVFSEWVGISNLNLEAAKQAWDSINNDIRTVYAAPIGMPVPQEDSELVGSVDDEKKKDSDVTLIRGILTS